MFEKLQPYVRYLLGQKDEEIIEEEEKEKCKEASQVWNKFWRDFLRGDIPGLGTEEDKTHDYGQKPKENILVSKIESVPIGRKNKPATPPPAIAIGQRRRLRRLLSIKIEPALLDPKIRSQLIEEDGERKILINKRFPGYKKRNGDQLYKYETCCLEFAKPEKDEDMNLAEYIKTFNELYSAFCFWADKNKIKT